MSTYIEPLGILAPVIGTIVTFVAAISAEAFVVAGAVILVALVAVIALYIWAGTLEQAS